MRYAQPGETVVPAILLDVPPTGIAKEIDGYWLYLAGGRTGPFATAEEAIDRMNQIVNSWLLSDLKLPTPERNR